MLNVFPDQSITVISKELLQSGGKSLVILPLIGMIELGSEQQSYTQSNKIR